MFGNNSAELAHIFVFNFAKANKIGLDHGLMSSLVGCDVVRFGN